MLVAITNCVGILQIAHSSLLSTPRLYRLKLSLTAFRRHVAFASQVSQHKQGVVDWELPTPLVGTLLGWAKGSTELVVDHGTLVNAHLTWASEVPLK